MHWNWDPCSNKNNIEKKTIHHQHWNCITHSAEWVVYSKPNRTEQYNLNLIRQKISHSCHTKYDLQRRRWQQRSKWTISFGDEMKQEHSALEGNASSTNIYVLIECQWWQDAMQQHQLPSQTLDSSMQQAFSSRWIVIESKPCYIKT